MGRSWGWWVVGGWWWNDDGLSLLLDVPHFLPVYPFVEGECQTKRDNGDPPEEEDKERNRRGGGGVDAEKLREHDDRSDLNAPADHRNLDSAAESPETQENQDVIQTERNVDR